MSEIVPVHKPLFEVPPDAGIMLIADERVFGLGKQLLLGCRIEPYLR
jgi:hypothetical protein